MIAKGRTVRRWLSGLLAFVMLLTLLPANALPAYSVESQQQAEETPSVEAQFKANIGKYAVLGAYDPIPVSDNPAGVNNVWGTEAQQLNQSEVPADFVLRIVDYHYNEAADLLWYQVEAAPGLVLPEKLQQYPWVFQDYVSNPMGESLILQENVEIPSISSEGEVTVTVSAFNLPEGASVSASKVTFNGEEIPDLYDIKIIVDGEEWQPIDHGTTVLLSIPVEGDIATVTHFVDYAPAIHDGLVFESLEGADEESLRLLKPAIDAYEVKHGNRDYVAVEIMENVPVTNGLVTVTTNSFSVYAADGTDTRHKAIWVNNNYSDRETIPLGAGNPFTGQEGTLECISAGIFYVDQLGSEINNQGNAVRIQTLWDGAAEGHFVGTVIFYGKNCHVKMHYSTDNGLNWNDMNADAVVGNPGGGSRVVAAGNISSNAFNDFSIGQEIWVVLTDNSSSTVKYIFMKLTKVKTPAAGQVDFLNDVGTIWQSETNVFDEPTDTYPNGQEGGDLPTPDWPKPGYTFAGWKVIAISDNVPGRGWVFGDIYKNYPALRHGSVTLEPQWTPEPYTIKYVDPKNGTMPESYVTDYTIESIVTLPTPALDGYTFTGWTPNGAGNWGTEEIPRGSSVQGQYGNVTLTANWSANDGIRYTVRHVYEGLPGQEQEIYEETLYGTAGQKTAAVARQTTGFTAQPFDDPNIAVDGSTVVVIEYTRNQHTVTWAPNNGETSVEVPYLYGQEIEMPGSDPEKAGFQFAGWSGYSEGMTMPDDNITFTALYAIELYTITFDSNGGGEVSGVKFAYNATVDPESLPKPTREGYTFVGWYYSDDQEVTEFKMPAQDITLYAKWEQSSTSLTIYVKFPQGADYSVDAPQTFLFTLKSNETDEELTVTVRDNGSVTINGLVIGQTYTVTMQTAWSWRYEIADENGITGENVSGLVSTGNCVGFTMGADGKLTFTVSRENNKWLDFSDWLENLFG